MQTENRLFDDLARMANGALNTISGLRDEIELRMRERLEHWLADLDMVPREEFEAIKAMAQTARSEQEDLAARVAALEQQVAELKGRTQAAQPATAQAPQKTATRRRTTKSAASRSAASKSRPAQ